MGQDRKVQIMEWPTPEDPDKSWGSNGFDHHYIPEMSEADALRAEFYKNWRSSIPLGKPVRARWQWT